MKKLLTIFSLIVAMSTSLYSGLYERNSGYILGYQDLVYDDFQLNLSCPKWQPRLYYYGVLPSSIGYFYVDTWDGDIGIYGSNRYLEEEDLELFCESLQPFDEHLLPYATRSSVREFQVLSQEPATISGIPAVKINFELELSNGSKDYVTSYVFTRSKGSKIYGYTYSVSAASETFTSKKEVIDSAIQNLTMQ